MELHIKFVSGRQFTILVENNDTIENLKHKIYEQSNLPGYEQLLVYKKKVLENTMTIADYNIAQESTLHLIPILIGGGNCDFGCPIEFNTLDKNEKIEGNPSKVAPIWRYYSSGINFEGRCMESTCQAYRHRVFAQAKFGDFIIHSKIKELKCPLCCTKIVDVNNVLFNYCKWKVYGVTADCGKEIEYEDSSSDFYKWVSFNGNSKTIWQFLKIKVTEI